MKKLKQLLFQNLDPRQTAVKNAFWLSVGEIGTRLFRASIIIYAARVLGTSGYGVFSYVLGLASFFTIFADVGLTQILTREVSQRPENEDSYFVTGLWIKIALLIFTALVLVFIAPHFSNIPEATALLPFVALLMLFDNIRSFITGLYRGKEKMQVETLLTTATNVTITVAGFIILSRWATPHALTITYVLSASAGALIGLWLVRNKLLRLFSAFKKALLRPMLSSAWPFALIGIIATFMNNTDVVMLGFLTGASDVGLYSSGMRIINLLHVLPAILASVFFPMVARYVGQQDKNSARKVVERNISAALLVAVPLVVGGIILSKGLLVLLFGAEYAPASIAFQILLLTLLTQFAISPITNYVLAFDKHKKLAPYVALGSTANIVLNLVLIPLWGIAGAAVATLAANWLYHGTAWRYAKKLNNFSTLRHLKKVLVSAAAMGALAYTLQSLGTNALITIALSGALYFALLWLLREKMLVDVKSIFAK